MKLALILLGITLCFASGCAKYCHPTKSAWEFERDKDRCVNKAAADASNWGASGNVFMIADGMKKCLEYEYGWSQQCP